MYKGVKFGVQQKLVSGDVEIFTWRNGLEQMYFYLCILSPQSISKGGAVKKNCEDELNRSILEMEMLYYPKQYLTDE